MQEPNRKLLILSTFFYQAAVLTWPIIYHKVHGKPQVLRSVWIPAFAGMTATSMLDADLFGHLWPQLIC